MRDSTRPTDHDVAIAKDFDALASAVRVALLRELRAPKTLGAIRVSDAGADSPALARQSVRRHLDRLLESHLVLERGAVGARGETTEYALNHQRLFTLSEELLELCHLRPDVEPEVETVMAPGGGAGARAFEGPCLVLVHGAYVGLTFALRSGAASRIGRHRDAEIALDFDPFVSGEHARVEPTREGTHALVDMPESRNGTTLNLRAIQKGGRAPLQHGDLVGVGRSLLLYRRA